MAQEIERKFLVQTEDWRGQATGSVYRQGYIPTAKSGYTVRVRIAGATGYITLKGPTRGLTRLEFEYEVPLGDAEEMLAKLCQPPLIEKVRYKIPYGDHLWELDEFLGENAGLLLAEVELASESEAIALPDWVGAEVTGDRRYYNSYLARHPYTTWHVPT